MRLAPSRVQPASRHSPWKAGFREEIFPANAKQTKLTNRILMGTTALTVFRTREFDGTNTANVSLIWRKFDGHPTSHGRDLLQALAAREFSSISQLVTATWQGLLELQARPEFDWQFCPVLHSQRPAAEWWYSLSLRDGDDEMPRGGPCMAGPFAVWLEVRHNRRTLYDGPISKYTPNDDPSQDEHDPETKPPPQQPAEPDDPDQLRLAFGQACLEASSTPAPSDGLAAGATPPSHQEAAGRKRIQPNTSHNQTGSNRPPQL